MKKFKEQLREAYDKDALRRDKNEGEREKWKLELREKFIRLLNEQNGKTILELGSGVGTDAKYFQDKGFEILATDLSPEMVKMCKKRGLEAQTIDLYEIGELGNKFDGVYSLNVLLHVPNEDIEGVLQNI